MIKEYYIEALNDLRAWRKLHQDHLLAHSQIG